MEGFVPGRLYRDSAVQFLTALAGDELSLRTHDDGKPAMESVKNHGLRVSSLGQTPLKRIKKIVSNVKMRPWNYKGV